MRDIVIINKIYAGCLSEPDDTNVMTNIHLSIIKIKSIVSKCAVSNNVNLRSCQFMSGELILVVRNEVEASDSG